MSTSGSVRRDMRGWVVADEGGRWSVKLDVRDSGGIWALPFVVGWLLLLHGFDWSARLALIFVLPLDFHGRIRATGTIYSWCLAWS